MGTGSELYPPPPQGDGNIRYYEVSADKPHLSYLTEYRSHSPQKGMGEYGTLRPHGAGGGSNESDEVPALEGPPFGRAHGRLTLTLGAQMEVCRKFCGSKQQEVKEGFPEEATLEEPKGKHGERMKAF